MRKVIGFVQVKRLCLKFLSKDMMASQTYNWCSRKNIFYKYLTKRNGRTSDIQAWGSKTSKTQSFNLIWKAMAMKRLSCKESRITQLLLTLGKNLKVKIKTLQFVRYNQLQAQMRYLWCHLPWCKLVRTQKVDHPRRYTGRCSRLAVESSLTRIICYKSLRLKLTGHQTGKSIPPS